MSLILANIVGWVTLHWRTVAIIAGIILIAVLALSVRSCLTPKAKLNEQEIQRGEQAVKERNDAALKEILIQSEVREKQIEANVVNAEANTVNAIYESKKKWENANISELQAEFERRKSQ